MENEEKDVAPRGAISGLIGLDGWMDGSPGGVSIERQYVRECRGRMAPYRSI